MFLNTMHRRYYRYSMKKCSSIETFSSTKHYVITVSAPRDRSKFIIVLCELLLNVNGTTCSHQFLHLSFSSSTSSLLSFFFFVSSMILSNHLKMIFFCYMYFIISAIRITGYIYIFHAIIDYRIEALLLPQLPEILTLIRNRQTPCCLNIK